MDFLSKLADSRIQELDSIEALGVCSCGLFNCLDENALSFISQANWHL